MLADPSPDRRRATAATLRDLGFRVSQTATGAESITRLAAQQHDFVLINWTLPDMTALDLCRRLRDASARCFVVVLAVAATETDLAMALLSGADDVVTYPAQPLDLAARLGTAARLMRAEQDLRDSDARLQDALERLNSFRAATERDLKEAQKLQQGLVRERSGRFGPAQLSLLLRPAGHVGGDLVGFFPISDRKTGTYALDVSGHGVAAALLTAQLSVHLSCSADYNIAIRGAAAGLHPARPVDLAHFFNEMMLEEATTDSYFTMVYAELDHETGVVDLVQAGHPHPMLQRADGSVIQIGKGGMPIGLFESPLFEEVRFTMQPGDRLLLASDGITEAEAPNGRQLGDDGLEAILRTNSFLGGHAFLESMAWSVSEYTRGQRLDDISAVLIEYGSPP
ncbi:PP2C family protein-serine/threonine phosphatase [Paracoccus sp. (in: a-proteobacteria)]|uniref:PP2C family protein-serine/threonine phosphatase n=1 Tax=Paracoccus sp. TaxID=267 RepID=UPI0026DFE57C|nr:fused response regulator/phosphatase [Paracoccus sp. (in: a-proteobacteria)]MDO5648757.1 fused response regulator/phosphatase [Paracoccus sp. (in: a-proteobacteria)]